MSKTCHFCQEARLEVGQRTSYGATVFYKIGNSVENGWFATLSPRTGGDPKRDFSIQLMPMGHITHFSQISSYPKLAKNYGLAFSKLSFAMSRIMAREDRFNIAPVGTYGKCTTDESKKEHIHIKIFPFRGDIGQPFTVDSSFQKKEIQTDLKTGQKFVKMKPVRKRKLTEKRFNQLLKLLISLLK